MGSVIIIIADPFGLIEPERKIINEVFRGFPDPTAYFHHRPG